MLNVNRKTEPGERSPESKTALSDVTVCIKEPALVLTQQTVVPSETDTIGGMKPKSTIETRTSPDWHPPWGLLSGPALDARA